MDLGDRKKKILALIIEHYISEGEPVGSKKLCEYLDNAVSSATIRNDMAWLVDKGYLEQPHTSAGRVPTQKGYRYYIDNIMQRRSPSDEEKRYIDGMLASVARNPDMFFENACSFLADYTGLAAVSTTPSDAQAKIVRIELMPTGRYTVLVLLMTSTGIFKSRLCRVEVEMNAEIHGIMRRVLNDYFAGRELKEITPSFIQTLAVSLGEMTLIIMPLLVAVHEAARDASDSRLLLEGQSNLLSVPEFDAETAKGILEFMSRREKLMRLLTKEQSAVTAYIGKESGRRELEFSSVLVSKYDLGGQGSGRIAIIGPTRMNYSRLLTNLEYFSDSVGKLLMQSFEDKID